MGGNHEGICEALGSSSIHRRSNHRWNRRTGLGCWSHTCNNHFGGNGDGGLPEPGMESRHCRIPRPKLASCFNVSRRSRCEGVDCSAAKPIPKPRVDEHRWPHLDCTAAIALITPRPEPLRSLAAALLTSSLYATARERNGPGLTLVA